MKKIIGLLVALFAVVTLAACSSDTLDGSYYKFDKKDSYLEKKPTVTIDGTIGKRDSETFTVDTKKKEFSANGRSIAYVYSEGELTVNGELYVKKGSKAYDEAEKSNQNRLKREAEKRAKYIKAFRKEVQGKYYLKDKYSEKVADEASFEIKGNTIVIYNFDELEPKEYTFEYDFDAGKIKIGDYEYRINTKGGDFSKLYIEFADKGEYIVGERVLIRK